MTKKKYFSCCFVWDGISCVVMMQMEKEHTINWCARVSDVGCCCCCWYRDDDVRLPRTSCASGPGGNLSVAASHQCYYLVWSAASRGVSRSEGRRVIYLLLLLLLPACDCCAVAHTPPPLHLLPPSNPPFHLQWLAVWW